MFTANVYKNNEIVYTMTSLYTSDGPILEPILDIGDIGFFSKLIIQPIPKKKPIDQHSIDSIIIHKCTG